MFDTVVLGGTYAGIGFCSAHPGNNLIISDSIYIEDYSPAMRYFPVRWRTEAGKAFYESLPVAGETVSLGEASLQMYRRAQERGWQVLYQTAVSEIAAGDGGCVITVQNWDGTRHIKCRNVLDTRPTGNVLSKAYHSLVLNAPPPGEYDGFSISPAYWEGQSVLRVPVEADATFQQARERLAALLGEGPLRETKLILTGLSFDCKVQAAEHTLPSCNFDDLVESYEQGYELGLRRAGGAR